MAIMHGAINHQQRRGNRANKVLGIIEVYTGGIAGTVAEPKLIFAAAIKGWLAELFWHIATRLEIFYQARPM
jgi:hypothetical protein